VNNKFDRCGLDQEIEEYPHLGHDVVDLIVQAGLPLCKLKLTDITMPSLCSIAGDSCVVKPFAKDLVNFQFMNMRMIAEPADPTAILQAAMNLIAAADRLEKLTLVLIPALWHVSHLQLSIELGTRMLLANSLGHLSTLHLECVRIDGFQALCEALGRCHHSLGTLMLHNVNVVDSRNLWMEVLQKIHSLPQLRCLNLISLEQSNTTHHSTVHVRCEIDQPDDTELRIQEDEREYVEVQLADVLHSGITLEPHPPRF
jgi:hypothetical protein